jgi:S1-C subfamily serine protease
MRFPRRRTQLAIEVCHVGHCVENFYGRNIVKNLFLLAAIASLSFTACAQKEPAVMTSRDIYISNLAGIVEIGIGGKFSGNGFIVSADGLILTANHVVATPESRLKQYAANISVLFNGKLYPAKTVENAISDDMSNFDFAFLKIEATNMPYLSLGSWNEVEPGDAVTVITSWPGMGPILLEGTVSNRVAYQTLLGPKPINSILFQAPIRKGFSGSPIFSKQGHIIGIVDSLVFGVGPGLGELRDKWGKTGSQAHVIFMGIDLAGSFTEIIDNLDQNLISGMGSGVAIDYAKEQQANKH